MRMALGPVGAVAAGATVVAAVTLTVLVDPAPQPDAPAVPAPAVPAPAVPAPPRAAERPAVVEEGTPPVAAAPAVETSLIDPVLAAPSRYHIYGWVTDYEAVGDVDEIRDVLHLGRLMTGYTGQGFRTIEEVGLADHDMVRYLANDRWTEVVSGAEWATLRAFLVEAVRR